MRIFSTTKKTLQNIPTLVSLSSFLSFRRRILSQNTSRGHLALFSGIYSYQEKYSVYRHQMTLCSHHRQRQWTLSWASAPDNGNGPFMSISTRQWQWTLSWASAPAAFPLDGSFEKSIPKAMIILNSKKRSYEKRKYVGVWCYDPTTWLFHKEHVNYTWEIPKPFKILF